MAQMPGTAANGRRQTAGESIAKAIKNLLSLNNALQTT